MIDSRLKFMMMVGSAAILSACVLTMPNKSTATNFPKNLNPAEWELVWEDDFNGDKIDTTKWASCPEWDRCDKHCKWSKTDAFVDGKGQLLVQIRKDDKGRILAGAVRTKDLFEKKFGYFEIRCKVPVIKGGWCAFWMMPADGNKVGDEGRDGTEIDIFESIRADQGHVNHALHWDGYGKEHKSKGETFKNRSDLYGNEFHTFAVEWNEKQYVFYIDDKETWRTSVGGVMQNPAYMKITLEAAKWAGDIHAEKLPKHLVVDRVRVFDRKK